MAGNIPNISRNSYTASKRYSKLVMQQGVPITDSDWNEMVDILRGEMYFNFDSVLGNLLLPAAGGGANTGFLLAPAGGTPTDDCLIQGGAAIVSGVPIRTTWTNPAADVQYDDELTNNMGEGTITSFLTGVLTDVDKNWQSFHDLIPVTNVHNGCRVKFTSGTESGNEFIITAFTQTTLTMSGANPAAGDSYTVKPPAVPVPAGTTTLRAFLIVWFEDINENEDTDIPHPSLGVESSHRDKTQWCVRLHGIEGQATPASPTTPDTLSFGVRYRDLGTVDNNTGSGLAFQTTQVEHHEFNLELLNEAFAVLDSAFAVLDGDVLLRGDDIAIPPVSAVHGTVTATTDISQMLDNIDSNLRSDAGWARVGFDSNSTNFADFVPTINNGGGLGNDDVDGTYGSGTARDTVPKLEALLKNVDDVLQARRAFTSTVSSAASRVADYNGADALENVLITDVGSGHLMVCNGGIFDQGNPHVLENGGGKKILANAKPKVVGESAGKSFQDYPNVRLIVGSASVAQLSGSWERVCFVSDSVTHGFEFGSDSTDYPSDFWLEDCGLASGSVRFRIRSQYQNRWGMRNCRMENVLSKNPYTVGLSIFGDSGLLGASNGLIENCYLVGPDDSGSNHTLTLTNLGAAAGFNTDGCLTVRNCTIRAASNFARMLSMDSVHMPTVFENCRFIHDGATPTEGVLCLDSQVSFYNCTFFTAGYRGVRLTNCTGSMVNCRIITGDVGAGTSSSDAALSVVSTAEWPYKIIDTYVGLGESWDTSGVVWAVRLGGDTSVASVTADGTTVDGLSIEILGDNVGRTLQLFGSISTTPRPVYGNITIECNGKNLNAIDDGDGIVVHSEGENYLQENLVVTNLDWPSSSIAARVFVFKGEVDGCRLDFSGTTTGTGEVDILVETTTAAEFRNFNVQLGIGRFLSATSDGLIVGCNMRDGVIDGEMGSGNTSIISAVSPSDDNPNYRNIKCLSKLIDDVRFFHLEATQPTLKPTISGCLMFGGGVGVGNSKALIDISDGDSAIITNNKLLEMDPGAGGTATVILVLTSEFHIITGNVLRKDGGATGTLGITAPGTGSVLDNNVIET